MGFVSLKIGDGTTCFCRATLCPSATTDVGNHMNLFVIFEHVSLILREIEVSKRRLHQIKRELAEYETLNPAKLSLPPELKLVLARHPLPLGRDSRSGITTMVSSVAHSCACPAIVALLSTSCPTATPPLAPPSTLSFSPSSSPRPASPSPIVAVAPCLPPPPPSPISLEPQHQVPPSKLCRAGTWAVPCRSWHARAVPTQA